MKKQCTTYPDRECVFGPCFHGAPCHVKEQEGVGRGQDGGAEQSAHNSAFPTDEQPSAWLWVNPDGSKEATFVPPEQDGSMNTQLALELGRTPIPLYDRPSTEDHLNRGTVAALAVVFSMGHEACWGEIVRAAGVQSVLRHALTNEGDWEWAGFATLAETELGADEVAKARATVPASSQNSHG